ncbi:MAG TPA: Fic family protein [Lachnospiraceae bacterium]|nr:Fic family protein [Lachnospiraceae bacterium]
MLILQELFEKADHNRNEILSTKISSQEEIDSLSYNLRVNFIYTSNSLAGNPLSLDDTELLLRKGIQQEQISNKDQSEVVGYGVAYDYMIELAKQKDLVITEELIQSLHRCIYQSFIVENAGQYRDTQSSLSGRNVPSHEDVPRLMAHLANQIESSRSTLHPIELATMAHKRLLDILPFDFGNGQVARLLMNLILVHYGYSIVAIPEEKMVDYKNAIKTARKQGDTEPLTKLIANYVIDAQMKYLL